MKVVILGKGEMLANLIEGTLESGHEAAGIFRHERTTLTPFKLFLHDFFKSSPAYTLIKEKNLHEIKLTSANSEEFKKEIFKLNADIIIVGTWRERLKKDIINLPRIACINVHPSLLPKYRGPNPYLQTIMNMEKKSGVTFHLMDEDFDKGAVLAQQSIDILPSYTGKELRAKTVFIARLMLTPLFKQLEHGIIKPVPQNENEASYFPNITGEEKMLDFTKKTAEQIHAQIRALHPWLPCYIEYKNKFFITNPYHIKIIETDCKETGKIIDKCPKTRSLTISCKDGKAIKLSGLKLYGFGMSPFTKSYIDKFVKIKKNNSCHQ